MPFSFESCYKKAAQIKLDFFFCFSTQGQTAFDVADEDVLGYLEELQKKQNLVRFTHSYLRPNTNKTHFWNSLRQPGYYHQSVSKFIDRSKF